MMSVQAQKQPASAIYLEVAGLNAGYDGVRVLHGVDFSLAQGEAVALLGRNGAGKSTLCSALFGLEPQVSGRIAIKGRDITAWPGHRIARLGVALVPQGRGVYSNLTVDENLTMAALWSRKRPNRRWVKERIYDDFPRLAERRSFSSGAL
ncbi:MAG: ATP-binding cassette domain-containing protein, partial [Bosea sp. (in: a-proteobacteria)]|nr:ATP-binding cassette domain-containing protein [Bosea sp. (in: a-proteobacteria)]